MSKKKETKPLQFSDWNGEKYMFLNYPSVRDELFGPHKQLCELQALHPHACA